MMVSRHLAGTLTEDHINETVLLKGWVDKRRDLGGVIFIDLRDHSGIIQVVFNPNHPDALALADKVRSEYVIEVSGTVVKRDEHTINPNLNTGTIEDVGTSINILNKTKKPPFIIQDNKDVTEELR